LIAKQDYEGIAEQIEKSKRLWEGKGLDGLVKRRESEADLILQSLA
jgi:GH24 family phage-related lysozyme (muramidase)